MEITRRRAVALSTVALVGIVGLRAAELKPQTIAAFDHYVEVTESRMKTEVEGEAPFLWVDGLPDGEREEAYQKLRAGEVVVQKLETREDGDKIKVPKGMVHHWVGTIMIPGVTLEQTIAMVQDYDRYAEIYAPQVTASEVLERDGNRFKVYAQLYEKKVMTFVVNTEYEAEYIFLDNRRVYVPLHDTDLGG